MTGWRRGSPTEHAAILSGNRMPLESVRAPIAALVRVPAPVPTAAIPALVRVLVHSVVGDMRVLPHPSLFRNRCLPHTVVRDMLRSGRQ